MKHIKKFNENMGLMAKTATLKLKSIKSSDSYFELCSTLFPYTDKEMEDDEVEPVANQKCYEMFKYGEYGDFEIIIDENFNIIGGKVIPPKK